MVLFLLIAATFKALMKWRSNAPFTEGDRKLNLFTMISAHVQLLIGAALFIEGVRRARLPHDTGGVGVVEVDERRITYLGPHGGGALSINELSRVKVRTTNLGPLASDFFWEFTDREGQRLTIPGDAENASALFDALTALPGADYEAVIKASGSTDQADFLVWEAKGTAPPPT